MATRGGKSAQEDTGRALPRVKSAAGKKAEADKGKGESAKTKTAAPKKSNGESKRAAPNAVKAAKAPPAASPRTKGNGAGSKTAVRATPTQSKDVRPDSPHAEPIATQFHVAVVSSEEKRQRVEVAAYLRAERAGFGNTRPEQDWIEAEREVEQALATRQL